MRKTIIRDEDYDFYSVSIPFKIAFSRKRKKYLLKQLEKMHPDLTASSCIDSHFSLKKESVEASVTVMEKSILSRYRTMFPGKKLYLEKNYNKPVFKVNNWKEICLVVLLASISCFFFGKIISEIMRQHEKIAEAGNISMMTSVPESMEAVIPILLSPSELVSAVFASVGRKGGRCLSFSWNHGICTFGISGCNSEDVVQAQYCIVSYSNNNPVFTLTVPVKDERNTFVENGPEFTSEKERCDYVESVKKVRNTLLLLGAKLEKEYVTEENAGISFSIDETLFYSALKICGDEAQKIGWAASSFSVEKNGRQNFVKIAYDRSLENSNITDDSFSPALAVAKYAWLFKTDRYDSDHALAVSSVKTAAVSREEQLREKLGQIRRKDGSLFVYYKNRNGKITGEMVEEKNAM